MTYASLPDIPELTCALCSSMISQFLVYYRILPTVLSICCLALPHPVSLLPRPGLGKICLDLRPTSAISSDVVNLTTPLLIADVGRWVQWSLVNFLHPSHSISTAAGRLTLHQSLTSSLPSTHWSFFVRHP